MNSTLNNNILLCMQPRTYLVALTGWDTHGLAQTAFLKAVRHACWRAVVPRCKDTFILDGNGTDLAT